MVESNGYEALSYAVTTEDGYILKLFRVKGLSGSPIQKKPVLLQHGILSSAESFVRNGSSSLAFQLVDEGFDVWIGNNRGNIYSRGHLDNLPDDQFFNYSFYEFGKFDLPAMVDKII